MTTDLTKLSPREHSVAQHLAQGLSSVETASLLFISPKTVATHKARIKQRMEIKNNYDWMQFLRLFPIDNQCKVCGENNCPRDHGP